MTTTIELAPKVKTVLTEGATVVPAGTAQGAQRQPRRAGLRLRRGKAKVESHYKRLQRFFRSFEIG